VTVTLLPGPEQACLLLTALVSMHALMSYQRALMRKSLNTNFTDIWSLNSMHVFMSYQMA